MGLIREVLDYKSDSIIIAFSSGIGAFDWMNTIETSILDVDFQRIYLMDIERSWWYFGFEELGGVGLEPLANFLKKRIQDCNAKKVMTIGSSMGGYGAIAFGCLLNADVVFSVVPQIRIDNLPKEYNIDEEKFKKKGLELQNLNLKFLLDKYTNNKTKYKIYYGINHEYDVWQFSLIENCKNVTGYKVKCERDHALVPRILVKDGTIKNEIINFLKE